LNDEHVKPGWQIYGADNPDTLQNVLAGHAAGADNPDDPQ
jgi:hypothetical protein